MPSMLTATSASVILLIVAVAAVFMISQAQSDAGKVKSSEVSRISDKERVIIDGSGGMACSRSGSLYKLQMFLSNPKIKYSMGTKIDMIVIGELYLEPPAVRFRRGMFKTTPASVLDVFTYDPEKAKDGGYMQLSSIYVDIDNVWAGEFPAPAGSSKFTPTISFWKNSLCMQSSLSAMPANSKLKNLIDVCPESFLGEVYYSKELSAGSCTIV